MKALNFTTQRLILKPFLSSDISLMQRLDLDPEVVRYLGRGEVKSHDESAKNLTKILNDYQVYGLGLFAIYEKEMQKFLGRSGLIPWIIDDVLTWEIGYSLIREAWGKGYASEAFNALSSWARENLNVPHVISLIHPLNKASIHVAEKAGMKFSRMIQVGDLQLAVYKLDF